MGGPGSGNWSGRPTRKTTVEESLTLSVRDFRHRLILGATGTFTWTGAGGKSSIGYSVGLNVVPTITLKYRRGDRDEVRIPVRLRVTPTQFGGQRWWFLCPLIVNGIACNRRVGKLYLPPAAKYFGCRTCHDLAYSSSQTAHQLEREFDRMGYGAEAAKMWQRMHRGR